MTDPTPPALPSPPTHPQRIVYFGTPEMAVPPLQALHDAGFDVALVITGFDKKRGRRAEPTPTPVKYLAIELGIPVSHDPADATTVGADLGVVVAFGQILRRPLLEQLPMVNLHFSLLPRWRGAAPVERAILAGDDRTGVCVMAVEEGLDTGAVYGRSELAIRRSSTAAELGRQLTEQGSALLVDTLRAGLTDPEPQTGETTYAAKIHPADLEIDWDRPADELDRLIRVGGAWTTFRGRRFKILSARPLPAAGVGSPGTIDGNVITCGTGSLELRTVQAEGKAATGHQSWANGARPRPGEIFGADT